MHWKTGGALSIGSTTLLGHIFTSYIPTWMEILTGGRSALVLDTLGNRGTSASQMTLISLRTSTVVDGNTVKLTSGCVSPANK